MSSNTRIGAAPARVRRAARLRHTASCLALLAGSLGLTALATPAAAQCVEGPPNTYNCAGQTQTPQILVGDDISAATTAGFAVDTTANGNGLALQMTGDGQISYTDLQASTLTGAGVRFTSTGGSGLDAGSLVIFSDGAIVANGAHGLRLDNFGAGDTTAVWSGSILNNGGNGVFVRTGVGSADLSLTVADVQGRDDGVLFDFNGGGDLAFTAQGPVTGLTGSGLRIQSSATGGDHDIQVGEVTGGAWGMLIDNLGAGATRVVANGTVTGQSQAGITINAGANTTGVEVIANQVNGQTWGIEIVNSGTGATNVVASGTVAAATESAIHIRTGTGAQGVIVEAVDAIGDSTGIAVMHHGSAGVSVTATGVVGGGTGTGIYVEGEATTADISIQAASVSGGYAGIAAHNDGLGSTFISASGPVTGGDMGILAEGGAATTGMTIEVGDVTGGLTGIDVVDFGSGFTSVRSTGAVVGGSWDGISVETGTGSQGVVIEAVDVSADGNGIVLENFGTGGSFVWATGDVSAKFGSGIEVVNGFGTTEIEIVAAAVSGGDRGIYASSEGLGGVYVTAIGPVSGDDFGIFADIGAGGANVQVDAVDVFSDSVGILAVNDGDGFTRITSTGTVVGTDQAGIRAFGNANSFNITIDANNASGGDSGVSAVSFGLGPVEITTHGVVEGGDEGIEAFSDTKSVFIVNQGLVRNTSGLSSDRAINGAGAFVNLRNEGTMIGRLDVFADVSLIINEGVWSSIGGTSTFGGGDDGMFNMAGATIFGGAAAGLAETTNWSGLEGFNNRGLLQLVDGGTGDVIRTSANARFEDGSRLTVDIGGAGGSDAFRTTGAVEIEPGGVLSVNTAQPLVLNSQYVVLAASGGLTGQFVFEDQMLTAFAGLRDGYTANAAFLEFVQLKALAEAGITPNQKAAAAGADSLPDGNAVKDALLLLPDEEAAIDAFDQLSGEIHPSARTAMIEDSRLPRNAVLDRLADGEPAGAVWGRVYGVDGVSDGDFNAARVERDARGVVFGVDRAFGPATLGVAAGWSDTDLEIARRDSEGSIESVHGLIYAGVRLGGWGVRGGLGYAQTSTETERRIAFPGFSAAPTADYDGAVTQGFVEAGYRMPLGGGQVEPFVNLTALLAETDAFAEVDGPAALNVEKARESATASTLGLRFETNPQGAFSLRGDAGWRHSFGDIDPVNVHAFDGGAPFTILGAARSRNAAVARVEARWRISPRASFGFAYDGVLGTDGADHAITGGVKVVF